MAPVLFILFVAVPVAEIALFIQAGELIGLWPTIGLVFLTAAVGTTLMRMQGLATLRRAQDQLNRGEAPVREVFDGACLLVGGVLLLTPGFLTDTLGLLLLLPPVRTLVLGWFAGLVRRGTVNVSVSGSGFGGGGFEGGGFGPRPGARPGGRPGAGPGDIEGEYRDVTPDDETDPADKPRRLDHDPR